MSQSLTGTEPGLLSLWNFETVTNGVVKDAGPGGFDGTLAGQASVIEGQLPVTAVTAIAARPTPLARTNNVLSLDGEDSGVDLLVDPWHARKQRRPDARSPDQQQMRAFQSRHVMHKYAALSTAAATTLDDRAGLYIDGRRGNQPGSR